MAFPKQPTKKMSANEKHVRVFYAMLKRYDGFYLAGRNARFSDTELRLIAEIASAGYENQRLISTKLADRLGVTRSAISQIVNRLEKDGVVKRVADDVDRKIAYIELTEETLSIYEKEWDRCLKFMAKCVKKFGEERFYQMCDLSNEFFDLIETEKAIAVSKL